MKDARTIRLLGVDRLADECADQTAKFFSRSNHDTGYCYELLRRAIVGRDDYAWDRIYKIYRPLVTSWVRRHGGWEAAGDEIDYFVNCAFEKMWLAMTAEKFERSADLAGLLSYFQACVHSVIVDHRRSNQVPITDLEGWSNHLPSPGLSSIEDHVTDQLESDRLWQTVTNLTKNEDERIVLRHSYLYNHKPSQIYAAYPNRFESPDEVYQIKRNLLSRLRRNPLVRQFLRL